MADTDNSSTTALPLNEGPDVHHEGTGRTSTISLEQDKEILEGHLPEDRFDDERMRDLPHESRPK